MQVTEEPAEMANRPPTVTYVFVCAQEEELVTLKEPAETLFAVDHVVLCSNIELVIDIKPVVQAKLPPIAVKYAANKRKNGPAVIAVDD